MLTVYNIRIFQQKYFRLIGVILFIIILVNIDRQKLALSVQRANIPLFAAAILIQYIVYISRIFRWHTIVRATAITPTFSESWRLYYIGIFLATITPAKLGELGKAAYLKRQGLPLATGVMLVIIDRLADFAAIAIIAIPSTGILFGGGWSILVAVLCLLGIIPLKWIAKRMRIVFGTRVLVLCTLTTMLGWTLYFAWAVLIAKSVGIDLPIPILIASFTIAGILSFIPIAPSGLGTRDAALMTLLGTFGVSPEQAVALAFLMFVSIILNSLIGGYYWLLSNRNLV